MSPNPNAPSTTNGIMRPHVQEYAAQAKAFASRVSELGKQTDTKCRVTATTTKAIEYLIEEMSSILDMLEEVTNIGLYNTAVDAFNKCSNKLVSLKAKLATLEAEIRELLARARECLESKLQEPDPQIQSESHF